MRASGTNISATGHKAGLGNVLYDKAGARPDLDLDFARTKSLKDRVSKENLITFTRSSGTAFAGSIPGSTYVDENGLLKVATVNWARYSQDFSNSEWTKANTTVVANFAEAPDGTQTANKVTINPVSNSYLADAITTVAATYTISVWIKAVDPSNPGFFDLFSNASSPTAQLGKTQAPTEWTRFTKTFSARASYSGTYNFGINNAGDDYTAEVLAWGFQVEKGFVATEYIPTNGQALGAPRFTHDPYTLESKGLLVEPQATNLIVHKDADTTWWSKTGISITTIQTAPTGSVEANVLKAIVGNTDTKTMNHTTQSSNISALKYTFSVFLKKGSVVNSNDVSQALIKIGQNGEKAKATVDLTNGTINVTTGTGLIENYGNGWYRASITTPTALSDSVDVNSFVLVLKANGQNTYTGAGESIYFYGPQLEAGEVATSYIPTSGQINGVTRSPDLVKIENDKFGTYRKNITLNTDHLNFRLLGTDGHECRWQYGDINVAFPFITYQIPNPIDGKYNAALVDTTTIPSARKRIKCTFDSNVGPANNYVFSAYVKPVGTNSRIQFLTNKNQNSYVNFNLNTNTVTKGLSADFAEIQTVGSDGWKRIIWKPSNAVEWQAWNIHVRIGSDTEARNTGSADNKFYFYGPQAEEASAVTPYIPSTDTFTNRQSNATFVDSNGIVRRSIKNFISRSHDIDHNNSSWNKQEMGGGSVTKDANLYTAPNGLLEASKYTFTIPAGGATDDRNQLQGLTSGFAENDVVCASVYMKSAVVGQTQKINIAVTGTSRNVCTVTDEWQRFEIRARRPSGNVYTFRIGIRNGTSNQFTNKINPDNTYDADTSSVYIWGAQIEKTGENPASVGNVSGSDADPSAGLITGLATELFKTTGTATGPARYSHDPETLTPTGLYLEPAATNLLRHSNDSTNAVWFKSNTSVLSETTTGPDLSSVPWIELTDYISQDIPSPSSGTTYTTSVWLKAETACTITFRSMYTPAINTDINVTTEWKRFSITGTYGSSHVRCMLDNRNNTTATTVKIALWGAQIETGSVATSNIETTSATNGVTRSADIFTSTATEVLDRANGTKPAFYTTDGMSFFAAWQNTPNTNGGILTIFNNNGGSFFRNSNNSVGFYSIYDGSTQNINFLTANDHIDTGNTGNKAVYPNSTVDDPHKTAFRYKYNDFIVYVDGIPGTPDTTTPTRKKSETMFIGGNAAGGTQLNGTLSRLAMWKTGLTNNKLDRITS